MGTRTFVLLLAWTLTARLPELWGQQISPPSQQLMNDVIWGIAHEGCDVFQGNIMRPGADLRGCLASHQQTKDDALLVNDTSLDQIRNATKIVLPRIYDEYAVVENLTWVMDHEGEGARLQALAQQGNFREIRSTYRFRQRDNPWALNALSALSDNNIKALIFSATTRQNISIPINIQIRDHIAWTISGNDCSVFRGEELLPAEELRTCYSNVEKRNHNGEAVDVLRTSSPDLIIGATYHAITLLKRIYNVREIVGNLFFYTAQLDRFKQLLADNKMSELRILLALFDKGAGTTPHLWNALADSEVAAIVNQQRLDVSISVDAPEDTLEALATLLDTRQFVVSDTTTWQSILDYVCGNFRQGGEREKCEPLVKSLLTQQGVHVSQSGAIVGRTLLELPRLPRPDLFALVTFRPGIPLGVITSQLTTKGIDTQQPNRGYLVESGVDERLTPATVSQYRDNGLGWWESSISADKLLSDDVRLSAKPIVVGVIDSGVDGNHPLLQHSLWKTTSMYPPDINDWEKGSIGFNYLEHTSDPTEDYNSQIKCHGTHVTGLVTLSTLASWSNEIRAMHLEDHIKVYSLKVFGMSDIYGLPKQLMLEDFTFASTALYEAAQTEIHLFNLSLRGPEDKALNKAVTKLGQNALIINAAGNESLDLDDNRNSKYDGSFRDDQTHRPFPNVLFVAALSDQSSLWSGSKQSGSNHGEETVEIAAPGVQILSTVQGTKSDNLCSALSPDDLFGAKTGTSQAAPLVTATAAMLLAQEPDATPIRVKERILNTCDQTDTGPLATQVKSGCRLNMAKAVMGNFDLVDTISEGWKRGQIDSAHLAVKDQKGNAIDAASIDRILASDTSGNVHIFLKGVGKVTGRLTSNIFVDLKPGEHCTKSSAAVRSCEIEIEDVRDVIFKWRK